MRWVFVLALLIAGCNRPEVLNVGKDEDVVTLPNGAGFLLLRRASQQDEPSQPCLVRARSFKGLVPVDCNLAQQIRP